MKSVKEITENYNSELFGIEITIKKDFTKQLEIKSFWGKLDIYENICKDLRREGYTIFQ